MANTPLLKTFPKVGELWFLYKHEHVDKSYIACGWDYKTFNTQFEKPITRYLEYLIPGQPPVVFILQIIGDNYFKVLVQNHFMVFAKSWIQKKCY